VRQPEVSLADLSSIVQFRNPPLLSVLAPTSRNILASVPDLNRPSPFRTKSFNFFFFQIECSPWAAFYRTIGFDLYIRLFKKWCFSRGHEPRVVWFPLGTMAFISSFRTGSVNAFSFSPTVARPNFPLAKVDKEFTSFPPLEVFR